MRPPAPTIPRAFPLLVALSFLAAGPAAAGDEGPEPKLAGTWTWTWKDRAGVMHKHILEVEGVDKTLAAREVFDDGAPVRVEALKLEGKSLKFTVNRDGRKAEYSGKVVDPDHVNGTVVVTVDGNAEEHEWKAERSKVVPKPK